jgi:uncharacterized protein YkwD
LENLEDRQLLAGHITFNGLQGVVDVQGSPRGDKVVVSFARGGNVKVQMTGGARGVAFFPRTQVQEVVVHGTRDRIVNRTDIQVMEAGPALDARASGAAGSGGLTAAEALILQQTNATRASRGLPALVINPLLQAAAEQRAHAEAASDTYFADGGFPQDIESTGYNWTALGQNDADNWDYGDPAQQLMNQWLTSPPHLANIVDPGFVEIGVAVVTSASGKTYGVQTFGKSF